MSVCESGKAEKLDRMILALVIFSASIDIISGSGLLPDDSMTAAVGESVTFTTSLVPAPTPLHSVVWNFGTKIIVTSVAGHVILNPEYEHRISLSTSTGSLELRNVAVSDTGEYGVQIVPTEEGSTMTGLTALSVYAPVSDVTITATSTDLVEYSSVSLSCSASGASLSFQWFKNGVEIKASDRVQFTDGGATVTISRVLRYDQGSYTCKVSTPVNNATSDEILLYVSYGPERVSISIYPKDEYYWEDTVIALSCSAGSRPPAQFQLFLDGEMLSSEAPTNHVLEQSGNYSCQAFNSKTLKYATSKPTEITVLNNIKNLSVKSSNHPVEGTSVNLTCDASGDQPTWEWMLDGKELQPSENIQFYDEKRVVSFRALTRGDSGKYTCKISNLAGSQSADYQMNVNYGPDSIDLSGTAEVIEGTTLKLSCWADSVPTADFTWTHNGTTVGQSAEFTKDNVGLSDSGEYICQATNVNTEESLEGSLAVVIAEAPKNSLQPGAIAGITVASVVVVAGAAAGGIYVFK